MDEEITALCVVGVFVEEKEVEVPVAETEIEAAGSRALADVAVSPLPVDDLALARAVVRDATAGTGEESSLLASRAVVPDEGEDAAVGARVGVNGLAGVDDGLEDRASGGVALGDGWVLEHGGDFLGGRDERVKAEEAGCAGLPGAVESAPRDDETHSETGPAEGGRGGRARVGEALRVVGEVVGEVDGTLHAVVAGEVVDVPDDVGELWSLEVAQSEVLGDVVHGVGSVLVEDKLEKIGGVEGDEALEADVVEGGHVRVLFVG